MTGLAKGTKYYVRAYAHNNIGYGYGNEVSFTTKPDAPTSFNATTVSYTQINLSWTKGTGAEKTRVRRSTSSYPSDPDSGDLVYFDTGTAKSDTGLTPGTHYYYSAWSWVEGSDIWSDAYATDDATTTALVLPTVTTGAASSVEETTATGHGEITSTGGANCDSRGFVWSTTSHSNPGNTTPSSTSYNNNWTESGSYITGTFNHGISSLAAGTKYYFRACTHNGAGWSYGDELSFTTKPDAPTGFDATTVSTSQVNLEWTEGTGAQKTMVRRSTTSYPSTPASGDQVYFDTGTSKSDTGLTPGTDYYYSAWSWVEGSDVWSDSYAQDTATTTLLNYMEGDVDLDKHVTIIDALYIAQSLVLSITLDADQLKCADTFVDDGNVDIVDALYIAQWLVNPTIPLWDAVKDADMLPPVE